MKIRKKTVALAGAISVVAATALVAVPALASGTSSTSSTHTLKFSAIPTSYHYYNKTLGFEVDKDVHAGKVIGANIVDFVSARRSDVSIGLRGGFLYGEFTVGKTGAITGRITGGSSAYKGARGTISGQAQPKAASVTVTYCH